MADSAEEEQRIRDRIAHADAMATIHEGEITAGDRLYHLDQKGIPHRYAFTKATYPNSPNARGYSMPGAPKASWGIFLTEGVGCIIDEAVYNSIPNSFKKLILRTRNPETLKKETDQVNLKISGHRLLEVEDGAVISFVLRDARSGTDIMCRMKTLIAKHSLSDAGCPGAVQMWLGWGTSESDPIRKNYQTGMLELSYLGQRVPIQMEL